jgi:hypothetical protein
VCSATCGLASRAAGGGEQAVNMAVTSSIVVRESDGGGMWRMNGICQSNRIWQ